MRPTAHRPSINTVRINTVRADALFISILQQSAEPSDGQVRDAVARTLRDLGARHCAAQVAQDFGDHPDIAITRMRWARRAIEAAFSNPELQPAHARASARRFATCTPCAA